MDLIKRPVEGQFVALMSLTRTDRGMRLIGFETRCVYLHEIHEIVTTDEPQLSAGDIVDRVGYLGFAEVTRGGVIQVGDHVYVADRRIGSVLGFDDTHFPNHYNILIETRELMTSEGLGLELNSSIVFR